MTKYAHHSPDGRVSPLEIDPLTADDVLELYQKLRAARPGGSDKMLRTVFELMVETERETRLLPKLPEKSKPE